MKKWTLGLLVIFSCFACKEDVKKEETAIEEASEVQTRKPERVRVNDATLESTVIYEANIRQYSPEGTFNAFTKDIPQLKDLGVGVIWLMPIHPISVVKRKAENDSSIEDIEDLEARKKYLGSPYAVADYKAVNPDFGTMDDFRNLVNTAHANGMYVIIDWVPNHTGWDHPWIQEHPEYYTKNAAGEITDPLQDNGEPWGWTDVADLDYDNAQMRQDMIEAMKFWLVQEGIDGFRCDVAHGVPVHFWKQAIPALRAEKEVFMLAEAELPELMTENLFDMSYAWEGHHLLNAIAKGERSVTDFDRYMEERSNKWEDNDILMNFVTNHDENAWAGPVRERMGDAMETFLALTYCMPGMPLIYSGQEYDLNHRLKFFEKDSIPKQKGETWSMMQMLGTLKNTLPAMNGGKDGASYERISTSNDANILAFVRKKGDSELIFIANLTHEKQGFGIKWQGDYVNAETGDSFTFEPPLKYIYEPWEYVILRK